MVSSVDFSAVVLDVIAVASLLAAVYVAVKGARLILSFIGPDSSDGRYHEGGLYDLDPAEREALDQRMDHFFDR